MTRIEMIKNMSTKDMAEKICDMDFTSAHCNSDCKLDSCDRGQHEMECCIRWLNEEVDK